VIDPRPKFGLSAVEYAALKLDNSTVLMGMVVDGVAEVLNLSRQEIEDRPDLARSLRRSIAWYG
jgi:chemotaxis signal transduction protein